MKKTVFISLLAVLLFGFTSCADSLNQILIENSYNNNGGKKLDCPENLVVKQADFGSKTVNLSWSAVSKANEYKIYYGVTSNSGVARYIGNTSATKFTFSSESLELNTLYYFFVTAANDKNESDSNYRTVPLYASKPEVPSFVSYTRGDNNLDITLMWGEVDFADKYIVYQKSGSSYKKIGEDVKDTTAPITVPKAGKYVFAVSAVFDTGDKSVEGDKTEDLVVQIKDIDLNAKPENFTGSFKADSNYRLSYITLSWDAVAEADSYEVWITKSYSSMSDTQAIIRNAEKLTTTTTSSVTYYFDDETIYTDVRYVYLIVRPVYFSDSENDRVTGAWSTALLCHSKTK